MTQTFTKLFSSITESTIWCEPDRTRIVWICMLAMADRKGQVFASLPGLANRARVPLEDTEVAIQAFLSPDKYSRTPDFEGRRIESIDGGWRLLNYDKYRELRDAESTNEAKRKYINTRRQAEKEGKTSTVDQCRTLSNQAEAEAEAVIPPKPPLEGGGSEETENKRQRRRRDAPVELPVTVAYNPDVKATADRLKTEAAREVSKPTPEQLAALKASRAVYAERASMQIVSDEGD